MSNENEQTAIRKQKLASLRAQGQAYPNDFRPTALAKELHNRFSDQDAESIKAENFAAILAGRLMNQRKMGKVTFADLQDSSGKIQLFVRQNTVEKDSYDIFQGFDIGDIIGVSGKLFRTRTGELSIAVENFRILAKALKPFPEKFHGLADQELRYRQRYLDLIINQDVKETFQIRSSVVQCTRKFMDEHGFLEVETPMMHSIPGGAIARPFVTPSQRSVSRYVSQNRSGTFPETFGCWRV